MEDDESLRLLDSHLLRTPYVLSSSPRVLVIGVGGGIDVMNALRRGASHVTGVELQPITVELPPTVDLKVVETPPSVKDATASAQRKPAKLETGLVVQVPLFIEEGELIRVDRREDKYLTRV